MTFFYDINKKLQQVLETPKSEHKQLNERDLKSASTSALKAAASKDAKADKESGVSAQYSTKQVKDELKKRGVDEGLGDVVKKVGSVAKKVGGKVLDTLGHGSDEDLRKDLQRKMGLPATGEKPRTPLAKEAAAPMSPKQKKFAALAEPKDKITFADKIAGAKKEVDEMLGDVAAEAMKGAVTRKIAGKRYGGAAQKDDEAQAKPAVARGRGRPKKPTDTEQGAELKPDWSAFGVGKVKLPAHKGAVTKHKLSDKEPSEKVKESATSDDRKVLERLMDKAFKEGKNSLGNAIQGVLEMMSDGEEELEEKAVSKKQQRFMGMVHAAQKGEKPASKEVAKTAKSMGKKDAEDFAATKHKGLPEKKKADAPKKAKKEKTEEAGGVDTPTASSGFSYGKGIYDSLNREIEDMIAESMNVSMNMSNDATGGPTKSITVTATDEDAEKLGALLKMAGVSGESSCGCGQPGCGCAQQSMDEAYGDTNATENAPDYPTETETSDDALQYSGGINKPKSTGQTTVPVIASQDDRQHSYAEMEEDAIRRMMEMAGIKTEAKKVEEDDVEEGNKFTGNLAKARAAGKKEADLDGDGDMEKVRESIFSLTNQWKAYKG